MIDSGAPFSVVSKKMLLELGIKPHRKQDFILADGTKISRQIGDALFELDGTKVASPVVFGEKGDSILFGVMTLEALGFALDPFKREIRPAKLFMVKFFWNNDGRNNKKNKYQLSHKTDC